MTRIVAGANISARTAAVAFPLVSVLEVELTSAPSSGSSSINVPLFSFDFAVGSFLSTRAVNSFDACTQLGTPVVLRLFPPLLLEEFSLIVFFFFA